MSAPQPSSLPPPAPPTLSFGGYIDQPGVIEGVGFWPRVAARLIDLIVHYFVSISAGLALGILGGVIATAMGRPIQPMLAKLRHLGLASYGLAILGSVAYEAVCEGMHGSTLGKLMLSMTVIREDGSPCRMDAALLRSFASVVDQLFFGAVGYHAMKDDPKRQRYGDRWAHTIVCKRSKVRPENLHNGGRFVLALFVAMAADAAMLLTGWLLTIVR
jgi:uncharacterized RDD family membrane protein YckC